MIDSVQSIPTLNLNVKSKAKLLNVETYDISACCILYELGTGTFALNIAQLPLTSPLLSSWVRENHCDNREELVCLLHLEFLNGYKFKRNLRVEGDKIYLSSIRLSVTSPLRSFVTAPTKARPASTLTRLKSRYSSSRESPSILKFSVLHNSSLTTRCINESKSSGRYLL